jgi:hypothetical protein
MIVKTASRFAIIGALILTMAGFAGVSHAGSTNRAQDSVAAMADVVTFHNAGSPNGNSCMDVTSYNNGTPVTLFPCKEVLSQRWNDIPV